MPPGSTLDWIFTGDEGGVTVRIEPGKVRLVQRYYDSLRVQHSGLTKLICESLLNSVEGGIKYLEDQAFDRSLKVAATR